VRSKSSYAPEPIQYAKTAIPVKITEPVPLPPHIEE